MLLQLNNLFYVINQMNHQKELSPERTLEGQSITTIIFQFLKKNEEKKHERDFTTERPDYQLEYR